MSGSPGTWLTPRGPTQGEVLIDPATGTPVTTSNGRLNVNAVATVGEVILNASTSSVAIANPSTEIPLLVNPDGSINVNTVVQASQGDSVLVYGTQDGTPSGTQQVLKVNSDGSINVDVISSALGSTVNTYNTATAVVSGVQTTVTTYTVPGGKTAILETISCSGENIAYFSAQVNSIEVDAKRTYFGGSLNTDFNFKSFNQGYSLNSGDIVRLQVLHTRPYVGNFNSRIQVVEFT